MTEKTPNYETAKSGCGLDVCVDALVMPFDDCRGCKEECTFDWPISGVVGRLQRLNLEKAALENRIMPLALEKGLLETNIELIAKLIKNSETLNKLKA